MVEKRLRVPAELAVRVPAQAMRDSTVAIFTALGMPEQEARQAAQVLIWADLRGIESHGVSNMMPFYVRGLKEGGINPKPQPSVTRETLGTATLDHDRGLGLALGPSAMRLAMEKAKACGIGCVTVQNGRHFGAAGYHAAMALENDMIGMAMTVGGWQVLPTFGAKPMVGLNPIGIAVPSRAQAPFIFDASMSSVAGNKIRIAQRLGAEVGPGWVAGSDGTPIMELGPVPGEFNMLPVGATREIGSHKGYSLAMMVEFLCAFLSGAGARLGPAANVSHHFLAYSVEAFTDIGPFKDEVDTYLAALLATPPAPGNDRVIYAGVEMQENLESRGREGIPYHKDVVEFYKATATDLGVRHYL
ncbi:MAG: Ldh family oxidoreductase [Dehalococcoidia bacterium]